MVRTKAGPTKGTAKPIASKSAKLNLIKHEKKIEKPHGNSIVRRRAKNGSKALREIRFLQKSTHLLIAKAPFIRVVREIIQTISGQPDYRITEAAVEALREASEANMTSFFEDANLLCIHAKRVTLFPQDIRLLRALRVNSDPTVVPV